MPNSDNNENNLNNTNNNITNPNQTSQPMSDGSKPFIEIPQKYYDNLAKEQQEKKEQELLLQQQKAENAQASSESSKMLLFVILNAVLIYGLLYITIYKFHYALILIPIIVVILSIITAIKDKKESSYPASVMVGGILVAAITFIVSMVKEEEIDLWTYYAIISAGIGFIGLMISSIITKIISDYKNIKALQGLGYILFFAVLIGAPLYLSNKYHEEFYKFLFKEQVEVKAETEEEFVQKTLKQRYGKEFVCGTYASKSDEEAKILKVGTFESKIDQDRRRITERVCQDSEKRDFTVVSKAFNEGSKQYIIKDDYLATLFTDNLKSNISKEILTLTQAKEVDVSIYPEENCYFYGDCANCDEYYERFEKENDATHQYSVSTKLNFEKEIQSDELKFVNNNKFKYMISITGQFGSQSDYSAIITGIFEFLNNKGYKNNYGYIISIYNDKTNAGFETKELVYKVKGDTNTDKTFKDPEVLSVSANK